MTVLAEGTVGRVAGMFWQLDAMSSKVEAFEDIVWQEKVVLSVRKWKA